MLHALALAAAMTASSACSQPWSALEIGHTLEKQRVGSAWKKVPTGKDLELAASKPANAMVMAFGCRGDYLDEIANEDREDRRIVRFQNDLAMVLVIFLRPVTAREGLIVQATLASLTPPPS